MKIIRKVQLEGKVNHRNALFMAALCINEGDGIGSLIFSTAIQNPDDKSNLKLAETIALGRIKAAFYKTITKRRGKKFVLVSMVSRSKFWLFPKSVMIEMLEQFKTVKERELGEQLGLKWEPKDGEIRELSARIKTDGPGITKISKEQLDAAINKGRTDAVSKGSSS